MAHIKEPKGVDFIINSRPLTKEEEIAISKHIKNYKLKNTNSIYKQKLQIKKEKLKLLNNKKFLQISLLQYFKLNAGHF